MTRMARVRAAIVAIKSSGQMMVADEQGQYVRINDTSAWPLTDDRSGHHDAANTQTGKNEETPKRREVRSVRNCKCSAASRHHEGRYDHQFLVVTTEHRQEPKYDTRTSQDGEADGDTTDTDANGVMPVDVECLRRPEHEDREEIGAGDERDDQCQAEDARILLETLWEHWVLCEVAFPDEESDEEDCAEDKRCENVCAAP
jgi:hypothetical protein